MKKGNLYSINLEKQIAGSPVCRSRNGQWLTFGKKNDWPLRMLDLYNTSPTLASCVKFSVQAVLGRGIDWSAMQLDGSQIQPNYMYGWEEFIRRISLDYFLQGSFAFQLVLNRDGKTWSFYHQPIETVRCSERDDDGVITSWWLSNDWTAVNKNKPIQIDSFIMRPDVEFKPNRGIPYLFVYETYSPNMTYYWSPIWVSAIKAAMSEAEFLNYDLRSATQSFIPSGFLSLPPAESDEQKNAIIKNIQDLFQGTDNAAQVVISFRNDSEDTPIGWTPFNASESNVNYFESSNERNVTRILEAFQIPSRSLIGVPENSTGFNSEGALLEAAFNLYNTLSGNYNRSQIVGTINNLFAMNGIETQLILKPLSFLDEETGEPDESSSSAPENTQDVSEDNIIEQQN